MKFTVFSSLFVSFLALQVEAKSKHQHKHKSHNVAPELQGPIPYGAGKEAEAKTSHSATKPDGTGAKEVFLPRGYIVEFENESDAKEAARNGKREVSYLFDGVVGKRVGELGLNSMAGHVPSRLQRESIEITECGKENEICFEFPKRSGWKGRRSDRGGSFFSLNFPL